MFFIPISRWAIAPVFPLLDNRREPGLSPVGYQFVSLEDSYRCAYIQKLLSFRETYLFAIGMRYLKLMHYLLVDIRLIYGQQFQAIQILKMC